MTTQANEKLQYLKRIKKESYARIIECECEIQWLREDLDTINSTHFKSAIFDSIRFNSIPNYQVKFDSMLRNKIWDLEKCLDEENKRFYDVKKEIAEEKGKMSPLIKNEYDIKSLRDDINEIDFICRYRPEEKERYESMRRQKKQELEQHLDERNKLFHDVEEKRCTH